MKYYFRALKNYAVCDGRATRRELIWFYVFHYISIFIFSFLDTYFGFYSTEIPLDYGYLTIIYMLATACPKICLQVRRFHDIGKSGNWWWGTRIPIFSLYVFYLLYIKRGEEDTNEYGDPVVHNSGKESVRPIAETYSVSHIQTTETSESTVVSQPIWQDSASDKICFCRKCGNRLIDEATFCNECGTKVVKE